ncbi:MAG: YidC/Oxa1 family membrane protein insertase [Acidimicrobiia bacterium]
MSVFNPIFEAMGSLLSWLYAIVPNYGIAIIMLTVLVRLVLYPLTAKQARSMIAMQRVQPEIKKLQAKYKDDKQKLNEEMMKFYKENKINPFGGCLPLLAQMPIFIALFRVLHDPEKYTPVDSAFHQNMCSGPGCETVSMPFFGMDLSLSAGSSHGSFAAALPYWILVGLVVVTAYLQQRQTMKNTPGGANPQAQIIGKVMPLVFAFISINLPAGVVLYFFVSNLWQMGQQELIIRKMDAGAPAMGAGSKPVVDAKSSEASSGGGGFLARFTKPAPAVDAKAGSNDVDANGDGVVPDPKAAKPAKPSNGAKGSSSSRSGSSGSKSSSGGGGPSNKRRSNKKRRR